MAPDSSMIEDIFELLHTANQLEETGKNRIEAATKYYEAVYLMRRYIQRLPVTEQEVRTRQLLQEKVHHYEQIASTLINDESSVIQNENNNSNNNNNSHTNHPLSPGATSYMLEDPSVIASRPAASTLTSLNGDFWQSPRSLKSDTSVIHSRSSQANTKLMQAVDLDEANQTTAAIAAYMQAAELYLEAMKLADGVAGVEAIAEVIKRRLEQTLDRIEVLKQNKTVPRALKLESQKSPPPPSSPATPSDDAVSSCSSLTTEEISVLKRSSLIASGLFLPWSDDDAEQLAASALKPISLYRDPDGFLKLNAKQQARFYKWARPAEIVKIRQQTGRTVKPVQPVLIKAISPYTIRQQCVTDCSFIAGLCICAAFERRFRKPLVSSLLHPQTKDGTPFLHPEGKYMVKLWLNGVARCVIIDDYLPIDKYGNLLCSQTATSAVKNQHGPYMELWVSLIEKAYMKLAGGYDFPGSNSGVDLFSLTGWIPERILFAHDPTKVRDFETPPERAWERIFSASSYGDCLITVSTERTQLNEELQSTGLVSGHAYAVLSVIQTRNGTRLLQLKNPWAHQGWNGRYSCHDDESWKDPSFCAEVGYNPQLARQQDDGVFWICWDDVMTYFNNFHLSWNPTLFKYRVVTHGFWPKEQGPMDDTFNVGDNPQYILTLSDQALARKATVWILVSRHVTKQEQEGSEAQDYLTVHIHRNDEKRRRIWYPGGSGNCILTGAYTNNPQVLVRFDVTSPEDKHLSLVLSQYQKRNDLGYTLSCFSTESFGLTYPQKDLDCNFKLESAWTGSKCGGPIGSKTFDMNPTFAIAVPSGGAILQFRISTAKTAAVNVLLLPVEKYRDGVRKATGNPVIDSGKYRHGFVVTPRQKVAGGNYVAIISNFNTGETGQFHLVLSSSTKVKLEELR